MKSNKVFRSLRKSFDKLRSNGQYALGPTASQVVSLSDNLESPIPPVTSISESATPVPSAIIDQEVVTDWANKSKVAGEIAWGCTQTLLRKLPECVETNPLKMAVAIIKTVIDIKEDIRNNKDELANGLRTTCDILLTVSATMTTCTADEIKEKIDTFKQQIVREADKLQKLVIRVESIAGKFDYERCKSDIKNVLANIGKAANLFKLEVAIITLDTASQIRADTRRAALNQLNPSRKAHHNTAVDDQAQGLSRRRCSPGTREDILSDIVKWANNPSSPSVFWLTGQAGAGKTTIAYTIAELFYRGGEATAFGASFFCSRLFPETSGRKYIIPTIAYHIAHNHLPYSQALHIADNFDRVDHEISPQMDGLIVEPWQQTESQQDDSEPRQYLVVVDALDEIKENGGIAFLKVLLHAADKNNLKGLKFLVASRPHPEIEKLCNSFSSEATFRLQDIPKASARADVMKYLKEELPHLSGSGELAEVERRADGLFVYAATVVRYLTPQTTNSAREQMDMLRDLLDNSLDPDCSNDSTCMIDQLYRHIMLDAFGRLKGKYLTRRLRILFTFLCSGERISPSVAASLVTDADTETAIAVLNDLYPVLYLQNNQVMWHHTSFPDFIFDETRSNFCIGDRTFKFWCDENVHRGFLSDSCFRIMESPDSGLRFNICDLPSSFIPDKEIEGFDNRVKQNILPSLEYACNYWAHHLPLNHPISCTIDQHILDFLQLRVLFWFEVMSLLNRSFMCQDVLRHTHQWICKRTDGTLINLAGDFEEAIYFASNWYYSYSTTGSTPHLYLSALASWSPNSTLSRTWKPHFPRLPCLTYARDDFPFLKTPAGSSIIVMTHSNNGIQTASGSYDGSVRVWDRSSGAEIVEMKGHTGYVRSVAFMNETKLVSGSADTTVRIWDINTGAELRRMTGHTDWVSSVSASGTGTRIVSGSFDQSLRVWDPSNGALLNKLEGHNGWVYSVAFSSDGTYIVSGSDDRTLRVWNAETGTQLKRIYAHSGFVASVAFSNDGSRIVSGSSDKTVSVWDVVTGAECKMGEGNTARVTSVAFSRDGKHVVSRALDHSVWVYNSETGEMISVHKGYTSSYTPVIIQHNWMLSRGEVDQCLMTIPSAATVTGPSDVNLLSLQNMVHVDFNRAAIGEKWAECYDAQCCVRQIAI